MSEKIFISYRRSDDPGFTGRLFDRLSDVFKNEVFMDVDEIHGIPGGHDYEKVIEDRVSKSDVVLAMIGTRWLAAIDEVGNRRLDLPSDLLRRELVTGMKVSQRVIPILVGGAMPLRADQLPEELKRLAVCQAITV